MFIRLVIIGIILFVSCPIYAETLKSNELLITGEWGTGKGEFGRDGEFTPQSTTAIDMTIVDNNILILDSFNRRVKTYSTNGTILKDIQLQMKWKKNEIPYRFAYYNNSFYVLIAPQIISGDLHFGKIHKFNSEGSLIKSFGEQYLDNKSGKGYLRLFASNKINGVVAEISGNKVVYFDNNGNFIKQLSGAKKNEAIVLVNTAYDGNPIFIVSSQYGQKAKTILYDIVNMNNKEVNGYYNLVLSNDSFANCGTSNALDLSDTKCKLKNMNGSESQFNVTGDIHTTVNGKRKIVKYSGDYAEKFSVTPDGSIYHLIALDDGVVVRKYAFN